MKLTSLVLAALVATLAAHGAVAAGPDLRLPALTERQVEQFAKAEAEGRERVEEKDWAGAERAIKRAARIHGGNAMLWYNLACVQALQGKKDDALRSLRAALDAGWPDASWPPQDSDLESLHEDPAFLEWLDDVKAMPPAPSPAPAADTLGATPDEIEAAAKAAEEHAESLMPALGSHAFMRAHEGIARWKAASWDARAASATDPGARAAAEWGAIDSLLQDGFPRSEWARDETLRRSDAFLAAHPLHADAPAVRLAQANARYAAALQSGTSWNDARAAFERDLLFVVATAPPGDVLQRAMVQLLGVTGDDLARARALHARLRTLLPDDAALAKLMKDEARGVHWRLNGLPEFTASTLDGRTISPASLKGRVTLIDFWATWCGPCRGEMPHLKAAQEKFRDRGFEVVGVSIDDMEPAVFRKWCEKNGVTWPQVLAGSGDAGLGGTFGVQSIPFPLLIGRDGSVVAADSGLRGEEMLKTIEKALGPEAPGT